MLMSQWYIWGRPVVKRNYWGILKECEEEEEENEEEDEE